jgi:hypothetical protein
MNVGGVETAAVYLSPQAITPLSASKEPIALALAARTDLTESAESNAASAAKAAQKAIKAVDAADKVGLNGTDEKQRTRLLSDHSTAGAANVGRVDVYV